MMMVVVGNSSALDINAGGVIITGCSPFRDRSQDIANRVFYGYWPTELNKPSQIQAFTIWWELNKDSPVVQNGVVVWGATEPDMHVAVMLLRRQGIIPTSPRAQHVQ
jgi:hypothetical protein